MIHTVMKSVNLWKGVLLFLILLSTGQHAFAQPHLSYYLPENVTYDSLVPTPAEVLGHEVGEYHVSHDRLVQYMCVLDDVSDRITLETIGQTHEGRLSIV